MSEKFLTVSEVTGLQVAIGNMKTSAFDRKSAEGVVTLSKLLAGSLTDIQPKLAAFQSKANEVAGQEAMGALQGDDLATTKTSLEAEAKELNETPSTITVADVVAAVESITTVSPEFVATYIDVTSPK